MKLFACRMTLSMKGCIAEKLENKKKHICVFTEQHFFVFVFFLIVARPFLVDILLSFHFGTPTFIFLHMQAMRINDYPVFATN